LDFGKGNKTMSELRISGVEGTQEPLSLVEQIQWGPTIGGALVAAALASVLHGFGAAVGLAVSSASPTWRDASFFLWFLSGFYLILVALLSYGLGGYFVGRTLSSASERLADDIEINRGEHGLLSWALATVLTVLVIGLAASSLSHEAASTGEAGASVGAEKSIAYDLDRLFRTDRRPADQGLNYARAEAGRILLTSTGHTGITTEDRGYLARLVSERTGLAAAEAQRRADTAIANAKENISRARRSTVILAFMAAAAALLGVVAAWFGACAGGRHREVGNANIWSAHWWRSPSAGC
jgi:hypothetical protein